MPQWGKITNAWAGARNCNSAQRGPAPPWSARRAAQYAMIGSPAWCAARNSTRRAGGHRHARGGRGGGAHPAPWTTRATAVDTAAATAAPTSMLERPLPFSVLGSRAPASALGARMITGCLASTDGKTDGMASRRGAAAGAATRTPAAGAGRRKAAALWCAVLGGAPPRRPRRRRARTRPTRTPPRGPAPTCLSVSAGHDAASTYTGIFAVTPTLHTHFDNELRSKSRPQTPRLRPISAATWPR